MVRPVIPTRVPALADVGPFDAMMTILKTARLQLREMKHADLDFVATMLADPEVTHYDERRFTRDEADAWLGPASQPGPPSAAISFAVSRTRAASTAGSTSGQTLAMLPRGSTRKVTRALMVMNLVGTP
jgi:hypothetical protein